MVSDEGRVTTRRKASGPRTRGRRWKCDACGQLYVTDRLGNGEKCIAHPEAEQHDWRIQGGMLRAEQYIRATAEAGGDVAELVERFDPVLLVGTTPGEMALCLALMTRWGAIPAKAAPVRATGLFG